jgi:hypothetical protein
MSEKEGTLRMMPSGQWPVCRPGETPHEITSGDLFHIEFAGKLHLTRMKFRYSPRRGYYTVDGYPLRDGLRAAIGAASMGERIALLRARKRARLTISRFERGLQ